MDECAVPLYEIKASIKFPEYHKSSFSAIVNDYQALFKLAPGITEAAFYYIPKVGIPVKVPPQHIPAHYREEVENQLRSMMEMIL